MTLFKPAENTSAYLKAGVLGFQGSGKTKTSGLLAIGLVQHVRKLNLQYANLPVFFLDSETGSDWLKPDFDAAGVPLYVAKTRSFTDLLTAIKEAEKNASLMITDSATHFWKELCESYLQEKSARLSKKANKQVRARLEFPDWNYLKGEWAKFTDLFVNSSLHMIICGRAGFEYDYAEDDDGKKQLEKTGIKMKAEGEFGFEPSLLVQMELCQKVEGRTVALVWREAHILKDRSMEIDGHTFVFDGMDDDGQKKPLEQLVRQTFNAFLPHIKRLNLGGRHLGVETSRRTQHDIPVGQGRDTPAIQRSIVLDEIQTLLLEFHPGQTKEDKQAKVALLRKHFGEEEITWTRIEELVPLIDLRLAYDSMYRELKGKPSQYASLFEAKNTTTEMNDSLPGHSAPPIKPTLLESLLSDLAGLNTPNEVLHWTLQVGLMTDLTTEDRNAISTAVMAKQKEINKKGEPPEEGKPEKSKPAEPTPKDGDKARGKRTIAPEDALTA